MKKVIIILITIFILGGGAFWYFNQPKTVNPETGEQESGFKSFFSFGNNTDTESIGPDAGGEVFPNDSGVIENETTSNNNSKLQQVTDFAVAGLVTFLDSRPAEEVLLEQQNTVDTKDVTLEEVVSNDETSKPETVVKKASVPELPKIDIVPALRFVARSNGHIYQQYLDTKDSGKISNTTIPTIHEAIFANEGQFIMYRYLNDVDETIQSFFGTLGGSESGEFLPENIQSVATAPSGGEFFYLVPIGNDIAGYISSFSNSKKTQIFTSAFTEWEPQWTQQNSIFLTTKPSYLFRGSVYSLNKLTGGFTKIFGGVYGLTTLSSDSNNLILYTDTGSGRPQLGIYNMTDRSFSSIGLNSIAEKCVWSQNGATLYCAVPNNIPNGQYPDSWYQGLVTFNDSIIKINTNNLSSITIIDTEEGGGIDGTHLTLSPDEKTLFMINKKDSTLWSLDLE